LICWAKNQISALTLAFLIAIASAANGQTSIGDQGCASLVKTQVPSDLSQYGKGILNAPRNAVRPQNLKWELPIIAAAGILIASGDTSASRRIHSPVFQRDSSRGSNIGLGLELGIPAVMFGMGCSHHASTFTRNTGLMAFEAAGLAGGMNYLAKTAFNRQYPFKTATQGEFWEGGKSFPSGHAAVSFGVASVIAHRYPHNPWLKWGAYSLAAGVSLARVGGKKHFPSDILIGGTLGYVTGTYLVQHSIPQNY
jgi:membrane-associated phospholipid phosphatase